MANTLSGGLTSFPNGLSSFGIPVVPGVPLPFTGNYFWVKEPTGTASGTQAADSGSGTLQSPFSNLNLALDHCVSGNNDVIFLIGTSHMTESVVWDKNQTHLVGICSPLHRGKRARVSVTGSTAYDKLFNVSANGCMFANVGTFYGFDGAAANICWYDSGGRNAYLNMEFLGFGDGTASTGTANHTAARAFTLTGSTGECTFDGCVFGVDTVQRNATNYTLEIAGGSPRNYFFNCDFEAFLGSSGTASSHLLIGSGGIDRYLDLVGCRFKSATKSTGSAMAQAFNINASAGGWVNLYQCEFSQGITKVETSASGVVQSYAPAMATTVQGQMTTYAPS